MHYVHEMPFGARLRPDGGAQFRLWAPGARSASLVLKRQQQREEEIIESRASEDGWYRLTVPNTGAGDLYQWFIDAELRVPDPASRFNPEGPHGPSQLVDAAKFDWDTAWVGRPWHEAVIYELHVGCFTPAGTYAAAEAQLPALAQLGVTAVQLMPLADFPGRFGWGYDGVLPYAPYAAYGSPQDLKRFIQAAHRLNMMVFLDVVYNHFGPDGNYLPRYAPQFFNERHKTAWGAAVNFDAPGSETVREFFIHNALYWLEEYRFDGLRFDAVHAMLDDSKPDIVETLSNRIREAFPQRHVHLVLENDTNEARRLGRPGEPGRYDGQWNGDFHHTLHVLMTDEHDGYYAEYDQPLDQLARVLTHGFARQGAPHITENAPPRQAAVGSVPLSATVNFLHNHDQIGNRAFGERLTQLTDATSLRLAVAINLLMPAPPMLFMGEEFGAKTPFLYFAGWTGELREAVREGRRREFAHFPRYAEAAERGELPDPCDPQTFERSKLDWVSAQAVAHREWRHHYAELLALRARAITPHLPKLRTGAHTARRAGDGALRVRWRFEGGMALEMLVNLSHQSCRLDQPSQPQGLQDTTLLHSIGDVVADSLSPWAGRWYWGRES
ncbi:malto-oligosyltrehalose trehalohydrolase [Caldimonas brevitalea]|uniref:Malto-oligosyltrehalose trehalohydrolase n=1 Tax=Caldimonas brevitalea TaxID=413882 RepID=A0A0G3BJG6_9BURK|nr:malto-oligosyltrehalose trehalohydrolase [Caldimonas brevitalea]AKJ29522.1 malto-oligosyltrehalose trehalohydrolase [Caldimonas brevitalea]